MEPCPLFIEQLGYNPGSFHARRRAAGRQTRSPPGAVVEPGDSAAGQFRFIAASNHIMARSMEDCGDNLNRDSAATNPGASLHFFCGAPALYRLRCLPDYYCSCWIASYLSRQVDNSIFRLAWGLLNTFAADRCCNIPYSQKSP